MMSDLGKMISVVSEAVGLGLGLGAGKGEVNPGSREFAPDPEVGGRGRMGGPAEAGPGGSCVCSSCGKKTKHETGEPCFSKQCPECGAAMIREW